MFQTVWNSVSLFSRWHRNIARCFQLWEQFIKYSVYVSIMNLPWQFGGIFRSWVFLRKGNEFALLPYTRKQSINSKLPKNKYNYYSKAKLFNFLPPPFLLLLLTLINTIFEFLIFWFDEFFRRTLPTSSI